MGELSMVRMGGSKVGFGDYTGDNTNDRAINLNCTPDWVLVFTHNGVSFTWAAQNGIPCISGANTFVEIVDGGFKVSYRSSNPSTNTSGTHYLYLFGK